MFKAHPKKHPSFNNDLIPPKDSQSALCVTVSACTGVHGANSHPVTSSSHQPDHFTEHWEAWHNSDMRDTHEYWNKCGLTRLLQGFICSRIASVETWLRARRLKHCLLWFRLPKFDHTRMSLESELCGQGEVMRNSHYLGNEQGDPSRAEQAAMRAGMRIDEHLDRLSRIHDI